MTAKNRNRNLRLPGARAKGFYTRVLDEAERLDFESVAGLEGLDDEITLLRIKIKELMAKDPDNLRLILAATNTLARLVKTRYSISRAQKDGLAEKIKNVITEIGIPLGVAVLNKKL